MKLRNHIPITGPANREPTDGTETDLRVSLGFEPAWYHHRCGVEFTEAWHKDPYYRYRTLKVMKEELTRRFPMVSYWDTSRTDDLATISGAYGAYLIPHAFGLPLVYGANRWPVLAEGRRLTVHEIEGLDVDRILGGPVVEELFGQMETIASEWGTIHGYLNWQGILNSAFNIRGPEIFLDMYDRPEFIRHFFAIIFNVMTRLAKRVQKRQRRSGFAIDQMSVSNCVMNMISPQAYEEFVFPWDYRIALEFERFGVHTCNWNITPYLETLSKLPKLGYLDMGIMSDLLQVKRTFPETRRAVMYSPVTLQDASLESIQRDMEKIYRELAPCDVVMADIQAVTTDHRVHALLEICRHLESEEALC